jgi:exonuclease III
MKILFWNIRGLGGEGRRKQLREMMADQRIDVVCLQETIKEDFNQWELRALCDQGNFSWNWTPARGHSRGTLVGVKQGDLDAVEMDAEEFFSSIKIINRCDNFEWEVINVYGPVQHEKKAGFLAELGQKIESHRCFFDGRGFQSDSFCLREIK